MRPPAPLTALLLTLACAAPAAAAGIAECAFSAYSTDPAGLNIRAGANSHASSLDVLPPGEAYAPELRITGAQKGWFRIAQASLDHEDAETEILFTGEGWVSGRFLGLTLNQADLHEAPDQASPVLAHLSAPDAPGGAMGPDSFIVTRLLACSGAWVEVEGTFGDTSLRGWTTHTCASQVTTCP